MPVNLPKPDPKQESSIKAGVRLGVSAAVGLVAAVICVMLGGWLYAALAFWDTTAIVFILWVWVTLRNRDGQQTANLAAREDPGRAVTDIVLLSASVASLAAVALILVQASSTEGATKALLAAVGVASVVLSWLVVHTVHTLRYAREFYKNGGGVDFDGDKAPQYSDFAYLAFTIGMTFQVSDTTFQNRAFRQIALRHALLSYVFGTVIVAATINLIAGLGSKG